MKSIFIVKKSILQIYSHFSRKLLALKIVFQSIVIPNKGRRFHSVLIYI